MEEGVARSLGQGGLAASAEPDTLNQSMVDMQAAVAQLHSLSDRSFALISQIVVRGTRLGEDISAGRENFSIGEVFSEAVNGARERLKELEEKTGSAHSIDGAEALEPELLDLDQKYTMQAQRDVYESHTRAMAGLQPVVVPTQQVSTRTELAETKGEEVGDNVEFF